MSECLAKSAQKIDFSEEEGEEKGKTTSEEETEVKEKEASTFQPSLWPWDSVRNKLKLVRPRMSIVKYCIQGNKNIFCIYNVVLITKVF